MNSESLLKKAEEALTKKDREEVLNAIHSLIDRNSDVGHNWLKVGQLALAIGESKIAQKAATLLTQVPTGGVNHLLQTAGLFAESGNLSQALQQLDMLIEQEILESAVFHMSGTIRAQLGDLDVARIHLQKALESSPVSGITWYTLSTTVDFSAASELFEQLITARTLLKQTNDLNYMYYQYAVGKAYSDQQMYSQAERAYFEGAKVMLGRARYHIGNDKKLVETLAANFDKNFFQYASPNANTTSKHIALLGLPRSGTTLLGQMLSCHSAVAGAKELNAIVPATMHLSAINYLNFPSYLAAHNEPDREVGKMTYLYHRLACEAFSDTGYIIDSSKNLNRYFGIWKKLNPSGKAIYINRNDHDVAWSCYKTPFRERADWSWHPKTIAAYIQNERKLLEHWKKEFTDQVFEVKYEALVNTPEDTLRDICEFLRIEFENEMFSFHTNKEPVFTSSVGQIHQPLNRLGIDVSKNYPGFINVFSNKV